MMRKVVWATLAFGIAALAGPARAQELMPEQSAAKAKQVLQQVIAALGGPAYLNVRDTDCDGRIAQFGTNDQLMGYTMFRDMWILPDKNRTEYIAKGERTFLAFFVGVDDLSITHGGIMVTIFDGKEGWLLDKSGVSSQPADWVTAFANQLETGMNNVLRTRLKEPGVEVSYGGPDIIDMKEAEWIDFNDAKHRDLRLAADRLTHLPLRWVVVTRDPDTRIRTEVVTSYTEYMPTDGVQTPLNIVRSRNGQKLTQTFLTGCKYDSNLDAQLFTRASLDEQAAQVAKKGYKKTKDKN
ncbi:MAG: hypothetical protein ACRD4Y_08070 [Candidatus Acidiferrales bacterium]